MKPSPNVVFQEIEGEMVLLDLDGDHYFSLDEVGARMWTLLGEHEGDAERVIEAMLGEFDVDQATLRRDLEALLGQLSRAGLVVPA